MVPGRQPFRNLKDSARSDKFSLEGIAGTRPDQESPTYRSAHRNPNASAADQHRHRKSAHNFLAGPDKRIAPRAWYPLRSYSDFRSCGGEILVPVLDHVHMLSGFPNERDLPFFAATSRIHRSARHRTSKYRTNENPFFGQWCDSSPSASRNGLNDPIALSPHESCSFPSPSAGRHGTA